MSSPGMMAKQRRRRGFSLVETIAAVVILAVGLPPMLWALHDGRIHRVNPLMVSRARWLAVEKLEDVIADRHSPSRGYAWLAAANYPAEPAVSGFPAFSRSVSFSETQADLVTPGSGYMIVTVSLGWEDAQAAARVLSVSTVLTQ